MRDWLKSYLVEKSMEALQESRTETEEDKPSSGESNWPDTERRQYERVSARFPVFYDLGRESVTGTTVNVCDEGMLVESFLHRTRVLEVFDILSDKTRSRLKVTCIYAGKSYVQKAEVKHFHIASSLSRFCRVTVGFWIPTDKESAGNLHGL